MSGFMLAETYHQVGILCRDRAHAEADPLLRERHRADCIGAFLKALEYRRQLAKAFPGNQARTDKHLDRLANTHGEFGNSIQLQQSDPGVDGAAMREEAYWQFKVAWKLYVTLGLGTDEPPMEYIGDHIVSIQHDEGRQSDIIARQRVEELLSEANFGTREQPAFEYPITYRLGVAQKPGAASDADKA